MAGNSPGATFSKKKGSIIKRAFEEESRLPPWLFQRQDQIPEIERSQRISQRNLVNTLNHIHFMGKSALIHLRHPRYEKSILLKAFPEPCVGKDLTCHWPDKKLSNLELENYQFLNLIISDGLSMIVAPAVLKKISKNHLTVQLPNTSYVAAHRDARRYDCKGIAVELTQSGFQAIGNLLDFSPVGFRIRVKSEFSSFHWFNPDTSAHINFRRGQQIFFSGLCRCIRQQDKVQDREMVLTTEAKEISRFNKRLLRNRRQRLVPSPTIIFDHPFSAKRVELEVSDISTSGFSVYEKANVGVLFPGMIVPELTIFFAGAIRMKCTAQVIYRFEDDKMNARCGFAILDMDINGYSRLADILINTLDLNARVSREIDPDALFQFFFDTGFIYPQKYTLIQSCREDLKETYRKLYQGDVPEIARHFTYQKNGRIYSHLSMVRAYERTWLIQHLAARAMGRKGAGFKVLRQIIYFINDGRRLPSVKMDYLMSYFRPDNKFPERVFGGFTRSLKNPEGCSMDTFAYLTFSRPRTYTKLPENWSLENWSLRECSAIDLKELNRFYNNSYKGLLLDALYLGHSDPGDESIEKLYGKFGFIRKYKTYALTRGGDLNAVLIVNQSSTGINLSDLLNAITILVFNQDGLPWDTLNKAIELLAVLYTNMRQIPVLIYPLEYIGKKSIPYERQYQLWILNLRYGRKYAEYMQKNFKIGYY